MSGCLANCSNQGQCKLNILQKYVCECMANFKGQSCQISTLPCFSYPCMNNGMCTNMHIPPMNTSTFNCECREGFYGSFCEYKLDVCANFTACVEKQGYCITNVSEPLCKCFQGYSGQDCEILSNHLIFVKLIISLATILAIVCFCVFVVVILFMDFLKYLVMKKPKSLELKINNKLGTKKVTPIQWKYIN